jgi:hypothetical protein
VIVYYCAGTTTMYALLDGSVLDPQGRAVRKQQRLCFYNPDQR